MHSNRTLAPRRKCFAYKQQAICRRESLRIPDLLNCKNVSRGPALVFKSLEFSRVFWITGQIEAFASISLHIEEFLVKEHLTVYRRIQPFPLSLRLPVADALLVLIGHAVQE